MQKFRNGIFIARGTKVRGHLIFPNPRDRKACIVKLSEGKNRQIRRMFAALDYRVKGLQRVRIGSLQLGRLKLGAWRTSPIESFAA